MKAVSSAEEANVMENIIEEETLSEEQLNDKLNVTIHSMRGKKNSSFITILNVSNALMGSALLVMPINFYNAGLFSSIITGVIMAIVSFLTANLMIMHSREDEIDYPEAILRVLGYKWKIVYNIVSMTMLLALGIIHFVLMSQILFSILQILIPGSSSWGKVTEITFSTFSIQYTGLILFVPILLLFSIKDLKNILKVNDKGVYMIVIFCIFLIYLGIDVLFRTDVSFEVTGVPGEQKEGKEMVLFTGDVGTLLGIFSLAFFTHNTVVGIMKYNKHPQKNTRDLSLAYIGVTIIYIILGLAGMVAVAGLFNAAYSNFKGKVPSTIVELLVNNPYLTKAQSIIAIVSLMLVFIQLSTVLPILCFFNRRQFFDCIWGPRKKVRGRYAFLFNLSFAFCCLAIEMSGFDINIVNGITGALGGFLMIYVIPILLHLKCTFLSPKMPIFTTNDLKIAIMDDNEKADTPEGEEYEPCREHTDITIKNKTFAYIFWGFILLFGVFVFVFLFYELFQ